MLLQLVGATGPRGLETPGQAGAAGTWGKRVISTDRGQHLNVGRKRSGRLLGISQPSVNGNFKHSATAALQGHGGSRLRLHNQIPRRTGAWLVASYAAIFDLDIHFPSLLVRTAFIYAAAVRRRLVRAIASLASTSVGGTSSGLSNAFNNASRNAVSLRSFSTFSPNTSFT
jgi:hypothetical protein